MDFNNHLHKLLEKSPTVVGHYTGAVLDLDQNSLTILTDYFKTLLMFFSSP